MEVVELLTLYKISYNNRRIVMKKIISLFLFLCFVLPVPCSAAADPVDKKLQVLEYEIGVPAQYLNRLEEYEIDRLYALSQTRSISFGGGEYTCLSEAGTAEPYGTIPTSDMILDTFSIIVESDRKVNNRNVIDYIIVYVDYEWTLGHPIIHKEDAISVNWDSDLFMFEPDSFKSSDYYYNTNTKRWEGGPAFSDPAKLNQGGLGYFANLSKYTMPEAYIGGFKGSATFTLLPKSNIFSGNDCKTAINIEYVHNKTAALGSLSFVYSGFGVSITTSMLTDSVGKAPAVHYSK